MARRKDRTPRQQRIYDVAFRLRKAYKNGKLTEEQITRLEAIGFKWDWGFKAPFSETHPELAKQWHPTKNGDLTSQDVTAGSGKKVWWKCPTCGYEWKTSVANRRSSNCPACNKGVVNRGFNDLATTHPDLSKQWHPTKNGDLTPQDVVSGSHRKVWWKCPDCGYEWEASIANRSRGRGCPRHRLEKLGASRRKPVVCIESGKVFRSCGAAAESCGRNSASMIQGCVTGKFSTAYGYHWRYATEEEIAAQREEGSDGV